jgi:hypothetical protein
VVAREETSLFALDSIDVVLFHGGMDLLRDDVDGGMSLLELGCQAVTIEREWSSGISRRRNISKTISSGR